MSIIRELMLAFILAALAASANAGTTEQARNATPGTYPECRNGVSPDAAESNPPHAGFMDGDSIDVDADKAHGSAIDEYLSFHAQVTEGSGKFLLMPWSQLRTHAD